MADVTDMEAWLKSHGIDSDYDGTGECNTLLEECKDKYNHLVVMGFSPDGVYEVYYTEMPMMYMSHLEKLYSITNNALIMDLGEIEDYEE